MRSIKGDDSVFEKLVLSKKEYVFNLFYLIRSAENALMLTDDCTYIIAQSNKDTPMWIFIKKKLIWIQKGIL